MSTICIGNWVEHPIGSKQTYLVVDVDATGYCTPIPNLVLARKIGGKVSESVIPTQYARKIKV